MRKEAGTRKRGWLKNQRRKDGSDLQLGWIGAAPLTLADLFWVAWTHWRSRHTRATYTQGLSKPGLTEHFQMQRLPEGFIKEQDGQARAAIWPVIILRGKERSGGASISAFCQLQLSHQQCLVKKWPPGTPAWVTERKQEGKKGKKKESGRLHTLAVPGFFSLVSCPPAKLGHNYSI